MAGLGDFSSLLGNDTVKQLLIWQVAGQLFEPILEPITTALRQEIMQKLPDVAVPVADAVDAVLKGHWDQQRGRDEAAQYGIAAADFDVLLAAAGEPPGLETLLALMRRGIIPEGGRGADAVSFEQGVLDSRLKNKWTPVLLKARTQPISPADAIAAWVRGQIPAAEALKIAYEGGLDEANATILYHTTGRPPAPGELLELARRGYIPWEGTGPDALTFQQGIYEGDSKDKWEPQLRRLAEYLPPPRTVTALLRAGSIPDAEAADLYQKAGLSQQLAAAYIANAHHEKTQATRELAKGDVIALYVDRLATEAEALTMLENLGYPEHEARFELAIADFRQQKAQLDRVVSRLRTLYVGHKIGKQDVVQSLDALNVPTAAREQLLQTWELERDLQVAHLSGAEVAAAVYYKVIPEATGLQLLQALGYTPFDAWLLIAVRLHGQQSTPPPPLELPGS